MRPLRRTLFKLAETLHRPVREIERDISSDELSEWIAYWKVSPPFDPWLAMGIICSTLNNLLSSKSKKPRDFIPFRTQPKRKMTHTEMGRNVKAWALALAGRVRNGNGR